MPKYTFTFDNGQESKFREIISRLDPDEYNVIQDVTIVDSENPRSSKKTAILEMDAESCLTFRLGMTPLNIRRERTEEELAEEKARKEKNTVHVHVKVPGLGGSGGEESSEPE